MLPAHSSHSDHDRVAVFVPRAVQDALSAEIAAFKKDVEAHFPVELIAHPGEWPTPEAVRKDIKRLYEESRVTGVLLVGGVPMHKFYMHGSANPNPLFYEDFNLAFEDTNGDGIDDAYISTPDLKLWVANVKCTTNDAGNGIKTLRLFFNKTHDYYETRTKVQSRALTVSGSEWPGENDRFARTLAEPLFGRSGLVSLGSTSTTLDAVRAAFADGNYAIFNLNLHSDENGHSMSGGKLTSRDILEIPTGALFTICNGCFACNWARNASSPEAKNAGQSWVFGKGVGQAVVGNVRSGNVYGGDKLYARLLAGDYVGKAYFAAKQAAEEVMSREFPSGEVVSGVILIGNPFLVFKSDLPSIK